VGGEEGKRRFGEARGNEGWRRRRRRRRRKRGFTCDFKHARV